MSDKLRQLFAMESQTTLEQIELSLLQLGETPDDEEAIKNLFRAVHTLKGSAGVVGLDEVSEFAHIMENLMAKVRDGKIPVTPDLINLFLQCHDYLESALDQGADAAVGAELVQLLQLYQSGDYRPPPLQSPPADAVEEAPEPAAAPEFKAEENQTGNEAESAVPAEPAEEETGGNLPVQHGNERSEEEREPLQVHLHPEETEEKTETASPGIPAATYKRTGAKANDADMLYIESVKLNRLIDLVGELVIANASVNMLTQDLEKGRIRDAVALMSRLVEEIRNSSLNMRMVPIRNSFDQLRRITAELSERTGKETEVIVSGAETELDKGMVEKVRGILEELVHNALEHGLEPPQERAGYAKSPHGCIYLDAYHDSGNIVIAVSDDGRGLDRERILHTAVSNGLLREDDQPSANDIDNLMFTPGFFGSAKNRKQHGADRIREAMNTLSGMINVTSEPGRGTTVQLYLPLSLAIIDGFLLTVGGSSFVLPLERIVECVKYDEKALEGGQGGGYFNLRGRVLPLLYMRRLFGLDNETRSKKKNIVVVQHSNREAGLVVDDLHGEFQAVIKPLGRMFEKLAGVSGATILGGGDVALILDVPALIRRYAEGPDATHNAPRRENPTRETVEA